MVGVQQVRVFLGVFEEGAMAGEIAEMQWSAEHEAYEAAIAGRGVHIATGIQRSPDTGSCPAVCSAIDAVHLDGWNEIHPGLIQHVRRYGGHRRFGSLRYHSLVMQRCSFPGAARVFRRCRAERRLAGSSR